MLAGLFGNEDDGEGIYEVKGSLGPMGRRKRLPPPPKQRAESGFVGLLNQGATCYLNSLLQAMYMLPEMRSGLFSLDPIVLGADLVEEDKKQSASEAIAGVITPDESIVGTLTTMGVSPETAAGAAVATKNAGIEEAFDFISSKPDDYNYAQHLNAIPPKKKRKPRYVPLEMQRLWSMLSGVNEIAVSTQSLTSRGFQWKTIDGMQQHDAHELIRLLLDALERSLKNTEAESLCRDVFEGSIETQIVCVACGSRSVRNEVIYDLTLQVAGCLSVVESLHQYFTAELMSGDSAYHCEKCNGKQLAFRGSVLRKLPPVLTIACSRFQVDRSTNWQRVKLREACEYPLILRLNHFLGGNYDLSQVSVESLKDFANQKLLTQQSGGSTETVLSEEESAAGRKEMVWIGELMTAAEKFTEEAVKNYNLSTAEDIAKFAWPVSEVKKFRKEQLALLNGNEDIAYLLHALIVHCGTAYSGHYYAFIRDSYREGKPAPRISTEKKTKKETKNHTAQKVEKTPASTELSSLTAETTCSSPTADGTPCNITSEVTEKISTSPSKLQNDKKENQPKTSKLKADSAAYVPPQQLMRPFYFTRLMEDGITSCIVVDITSLLGMTIYAVSEVVKMFPNPKYRTPAVPLAAVEAKLQELHSLPWSKLMSHFGVFSTPLDKFLRHYPAVTKLLPGGRVCLKDSIYQFCWQGDFDMFLAMYSVTMVPVLSAMPSSGNQKNETKQKNGRNEQNSNNVDSNSKKAPQTKGNNTPTEKNLDNKASNRKVDGEKSPKKEKSNSEKPKDSIQKESESKIDASASVNEIVTTNESPATESTAAVPLRGSWAKRTTLTAEGISAESTSVHEVDSTTVSTDVTEGTPEVIVEDTVDTATQSSKIIKEIRSLAEALFNATVGGFFEFNDQNVTPVSPHTVMAAFQGVNSAYLLLYRRAGVTEIVSQHLPKLPTAPEMWQAEVTSRNEELVEMRASFDDLVSALDVRFVSSASLNYSAPFFTISDELLKTDTLRVDGRKTVRDVLPDILKHCAIENVSDDELSLWHLSILDSYDEGRFYPLSPLSIDNDISSLLDGGLVLVWREESSSTSEGSVLRQVRVAGDRKLQIAMGEACRPVGMSVSILTAPSVEAFQTVGCTPSDLAALESAWRSASAPAVLSGSSSSLQKVIYVPGHLTWNRAAEFLACECGLSPEDAVLSVKTSVTSSRPGNGKKGSAVGNKHSVALLWECGRLEPLRVTPVWTNENEEETVEVLLNGDMCVSEVKPFDGIWIEHREARGFASESLAKSLNEYSSLSQNVSVTICGDVWELLDEDESSEVRKKLSMKDELTVSVRRGASTFELLACVLLSANLPLRLVGALGLSAELGGSPLPSTESFIVNGVNSKHPAVVLSTFTSEYVTPMVDLNVRIVIGNSLETQAKGGETLTWISVSVSPDSSIRELRDILGTRTLGLPYGWTETEFDNDAIVAHLANAEKMNLEKLDNGSADADALLALQLLNNWKGGRRLRKMERILGQTMWPTELLTETDRRGKIVSVKDAELISGDYIQFEDSLPLRPGTVALPISLWSSVTPAADSNTDIVSSQPQSEDEAMTLIRQLSCQKECCLSNLGELTCHLEDTILSFHTRVQALLAKNGHKVEPEEFVLRRLRPDLLPGRAYWIDKLVGSKGGISSTITLPGSKKNSNTSSSICSATDTLRRLDFFSGSAYAVEIITKDGTAATTASQGSLRVWMQHVSNPASSAVGGTGAILTPTWPPMEVTIRGGALPTMAHLTNSLVDALPELDAEHIVIFRHSPDSHSWQPIKTDLQSVIAAANVGEKKGRYVTQAPYNLRDGDLLAVYDLRELPKGTTVPLTLQRTEDFAHLLLRDAQRKRKREEAARNASLSGSYTRNKNIPNHLKRVEKGLEICIEDDFE